MGLSILLPGLGPREGFYCPTMEWNRSLKNTIWEGGFILKSATFDAPVHVYDEALNTGRGGDGTVCVL